MAYLNNDRLRQTAFLIILILLGGLLFWELRGFLSAFLGAITLYMVMRKWMRVLTIKKKWKPGLAAGILMLLSFVVIMVPIGLFVNMLSGKINEAILNSSQLIAGVNTFIQDIGKRLDTDLLSGNNLQKVSTKIAQALPTILGATVNSIATIGMMYFMLYFMLVNGRKMELTIYEYIPLKDENVERLGKEMKSSVLSNALGIPLIAFLQGIVALIGYVIFGVDQPFFWFVATCIAAMMPVVGAALIYVPLGIMLLTQNMTWQGVGLLLYGFIVVGVVDNVFRMYLMKRMGETHPLVTIFGVIIGVGLFGFIGLVFGPLLISLFLLLLKIYTNEFAVKQREHNGYLEN
jgi:predicted PurR-regulated permease PerM